LSDAEKHKSFNSENKNMRKRDETLQRVISNIRCYPREVRERIIPKLLRVYRTNERELALAFFEGYSYPEPCSSEILRIKAAKMVARVGGLQEEYDNMIRLMNGAQQRVRNLDNELLKEAVERKNFFSATDYAFELGNENLAVGYLRKGIDELRMTTPETLKMKESDYRKWFKKQLDSLIYTGSRYYDKLKRANLLTTITDFVSEKPYAISMFEEELKSDTETSSVYQNYRVARFCAACLGKTELTQLYEDLLLLNL
jgi:hypothetical protein